MISRAIAALLCALAYLPAAHGGEPVVTPARVASWIGAQAAPLATLTLSEDFSDLAPLRDIVGDARVVGFGEAMHNTHEFWSFRNRLAAYLVQELGFTAIALETGFIDSIAADDYIQGGSVDRDVAARAVFSWSRSVYAENQQLIDWLRQHNAARPAHQRVRLYGLEMLSRGEFDGRCLIEAALSFAAQVEPAAVAELERRFTPLLATFNDSDYAKATAAQQLALLAATHDLVTLYERHQVAWIARTSTLAYQRAYHESVVARQMLTYLRAGGEGRDIADAQNLRWVLEREGPRARVFVFAHNGHLSKRAPLDQPSRKPGQALRSPMGELLRDYLGDDMVVIGSLFDQGTVRELFGLYGPVNSTYPITAPLPDSLNALLARAHPAPYLLDLRKLRGADVERWFDQPARMRHVAGYDAFDIRASFDALLFAGNISPQRLMRGPEAVARGCGPQHSPAPAVIERTQR